MAYLLGLQALLCNTLCKMSCINVMKYDFGEVNVMSNKNNPNLTEMIREIHDGVAREMYCKGIDDFVKFASDMPTVETEDGTIRPMRLEEMAEKLKEMENK